MKKISLFIDYQNVYMRARAVFFNSETIPNTFGQINPGALGRLIAERFPDGEISKVYVYRSMPIPKDSKNYAASRKQMTFWRQDPTVEVKTLPLKYPKPHELNSVNLKPKEKGIDVLLAIDFATKAFKKNLILESYFQLILI